MIQGYKEEEKRERIISARREGKREKGTSLRLFRSGEENRILQHARRKKLKRAA